MNDFSKFVKGQCEIPNCVNIGEEVHHLNPQEFSNEDGFIDSFHKNHRGNLINICKKCHLKITKNKTIYKKVKTSKGMELHKI